MEVLDIVSYSSSDMVTVVVSLVVVEVTVVVSLVLW
jgi:hypothetical protein